MRIAVVGSGYVGLVAGACFADMGHQVILVDNDQQKLAALKNGEVPIHEKFLPELLDRLRRRHALRRFPLAVQARVAGMSAATVDRALKPLREQARARRGISTTKAGTLLKRQIAIRTFADWTEARPGFLEMDLVAHCGWSAAASSCTR